MSQQLSLFSELAQPVLIAKGKSSQAKPAPSVLRQTVADYLPTVNDLPATERPRARLEHYGSGALTTSELLAVLLGTPQQLHDAERLLATLEGLPGIAQANWTELCDQLGIGPTCTARIKAALELSRRLLVAAPSEKPVVRSPADAANMLMAEMSLLQQEHLCTVLLDTRNRVTEIHIVKLIVQPNGRPASVLNPTAGVGRLLTVFKGHPVLGIELDESMATIARRALGKEQVRTGDILAYAPYLQGIDVAALNPPYDLRWQRATKHVKSEIKDDRKETLHTYVDLGYSICEVRPEDGSDTIVLKETSVAEMEALITVLGTPQVKTAAELPDIPKWRAELTRLRDKLAERNGGKRLYNGQREDVMLLATRGGAGLYYDGYPRACNCPAACRIRSRAPEW